MQIDAFLPQQRLGARMHSIEGRGESVCIDRFPLDLDPLGRFHQVRRGEQPRAISRGAQPGFDHRGSGAFTVGACDVYYAAGALRIVERLEQHVNPLQPQLGGLDFVAQRVEEADGIGIIHQVGQASWPVQVQAWPPPNP